MVKYNRFLFILSNFVISFSIFLLLFLSRYNFFSFLIEEERTLGVFSILLFLIYSLFIVVFNIALKVYEVNKIYSFIESLPIHFLSSIFVSIIISFYFYFTKTNFARFVFFAGFAIVPIINSLYNKVVFSAVFTGNKKYKLFLLSKDRKKRELLEKLIDKYKKIFSLYLTTINDNNKISKEELKNIDILVIDTEANYSDDELALLNDYELDGRRIYSLLDIFIYFDQKIPPSVVANYNMELFTSYKFDSIYTRYIKRVGDIIVASILILFSSPILLITIIIIALTSKGNVFYVQKRVGINQKEFNMLKFRSMVTNAEEDGVKFTKKNDNRITLIGKIIRPLRIDELPQLFNILNGDMSFIGPRPERPEFINEITKKIPLFKKRLLVKPGLTGWAQVKYSYVNTIDDMEEKLSYDLYYISNIGPLLDLKISLYTLETVIFRRGAI